MAAVDVQQRRLDNHIDNDNNIEFPKQRLRVYNLEKAPLGIQEIFKQHR
jgi:hypothetical protein